MPVRSVLLWQGTEPATGPTVRYTTPTGFRTIIKGVLVSNTFNGFNRAYLGWKHAGTVGAYMLVGLDNFGTVGESKQLNVWAVLNEGDSIVTDALHANVYFIISGAELEL